MESTRQSEHESRLVALLTEIQLPLLQYVRSLLPGDPSARDVAQQANATIWTKRADFELGTNFKAWAFSIARFEVLNHRKQQARDARLVFSQELEETIGQELADAGSDLDRWHTALQACLRKMRPADRELILHRYAKTGTLAEYADRVGRSVGGLKVTLHRLRNALLDCMKRHAESQEAPA